MAIGYIRSSDKEDLDYGHVGIDDVVIFSTYDECFDDYENLVTEMNPVVMVNGIEFEAGGVLRNCAPVDFRVQVSSYYEEIELED